MKVYVINYDDQLDQNGNVVSSAKKALEQLREYGEVSDPEPLKTLYAGAKLRTDCERACAYRVFVL